MHRGSYNLASLTFCELSCCHIHLQSVLQSPLHFLKFLLDPQVEKSSETLQTSVSTVRCDHVNKRKKTETPAPFHRRSTPTQREVFIDLYCKCNHDHCVYYMYKCNYNLTIIMYIHVYACIVYQYMYFHVFNLSSISGF